MKICPECKSENIRRDWTATSQMDGDYSWSEQYLGLARVMPGSQRTYYACECLDCKHAWEEPCD